MIHEQLRYWHSTVRASWQGNDCLFALCCSTIGHMLQHHVKAVCLPYIVFKARHNHTWQPAAWPSGRSQRWRQPAAPPSHHSVRPAPRPGAPAPPAAPPPAPCAPCTSLWLETLSDRRTDPKLATSGGIQLTATGILAHLHANLLPCRNPFPLNLAQQAARKMSGRESSPAAVREAGARGGVHGGQQRERLRRRQSLQLLRQRGALAEVLAQQHRQAPLDDLPARQRISLFWVLI